MPQNLQTSSSRTVRIDFHVHLGVYASHKPWVTEWIKQSNPDPEGYDAYISRYSDPGAFEELLAAEGVDYACILAELCPVTTGMCTNEQVEAFCKGRKKLIPFCNINPHLTTDLGSELRHQVEVEGFRGVKLYPTYQHYYLNDPRIYPLYQAAQDLKIPVLIHTGSSVFKGSRMTYGGPLHLAGPRVLHHGALPIRGSSAEHSEDGGREARRRRRGGSEVTRICPPAGKTGGQKAS